MINTGVFAFVRRFDDYPFGLLGIILWAHARPHLSHQISQFALPAGTRHRILHYAGSQRPEDALLSAQKEEKRAA